MAFEHYAFPAVFTWEDRGVSINFPDLPGCFSCAENFRKAVKSAQEVLQLHIASMIMDDEQIPEPSAIENVERAKDDLVALIEIKL